MRTEVRAPLDGRCAVKSGGVSARELARILGLKSDNSVRKAVRTGRIVKLADDRFDPEDCKRRWKESTSQPRSARPPSTPTRPDWRPARRPGSRPRRGRRPTPVSPRRGGPSPRPTQPPPDDEDDFEDEEHVPLDGVTTAEAVRLQAIEKVRRLRWENAVAELSVLDQAIVLQEIETMSRETRKSWNQFSDNCCASLAAKWGLPQQRVSIDLREAVTDHLRTTIYRQSNDKRTGKIERAQASIRVKPS